MKINKDIIFAICLICWLISNILTCIFFDTDGVFVSNLIWIMLFSIIVLFKRYNENFAWWLEKPIKIKQDEKH